MKVSFVADKPASTGIAVIPVAAKQMPLGSGGAYFKANKKAYEAAVKAVKFGGENGQSFDLYGLKSSGAARLCVRGIGKQADFSAEMFAAGTVKSLLLSGEKTLTLHLDGYNLDAGEIAKAALGARLAAYRFDGYRTKLPKSKRPNLKILRISCENPRAAKAAYDNFYGPIGDGQILARDLVNEPANILYPESYARRIEAALPQLGIEVTVLGEAEMAKLGMNALIGVGQGSRRESQLVVMRWQGGADNDSPVALVGKGVTFDTGGISLKPGAGMWDMKGDMGGSAAVVGAMQALAARGSRANVIGVVGLVENMPDGTAQLPGDIVTSMSGQTIEVQNTDAEGRLVLADALHYVISEYQPKAVINLATLTGAIIVALGHEHAGLFSNNDALAAQLLAASKTSTENIWRLPLGSAYDKLINSPNADMKNIGGRAAGSITAAQFLQRFVGKTHWAHLDIAGTGMKNKRHDPRETTFGTGFGVRLLNQWVFDNHEQAKPDGGEKSA